MEVREPDHRKGEHSSHHLPAGLMEVREPRATGASTLLNYFYEYPLCMAAVRQESDYITWFQIKPDCIKRFTLTVEFRVS
jgi:hypothetical protein